MPHPAGTSYEYIKIRCHLIFIYSHIDRIQININTSAGRSGLPHPLLQSVSEIHQCHSSLYHPEHPDGPAEIEFFRVLHGFHQTHGRIHCRHERRNPVLIHLFIVLSFLIIIVLRQKMHDIMILVKKVGVVYETDCYSKTSDFN